MHKADDFGIRPLGSGKEILRQTIFHLLFFLRREHRAPRERNSDTHTTTVRFAISPSTSPAPSPTPGGQDPRHRPWTHRQLPTPFQEEAGSGDSP